VAKGREFEALTARYQSQKTSRDFVIHYTFEICGLVDSSASASASLSSVSD